MILVLPISQFILPIYQLKVTTKLNTWVFFSFSFEGNEKKLNFLYLFTRPLIIAYFFNIIQFYRNKWTLFLSGEVPRVIFTECGQFSLFKKA